MPILWALAKEALAPRRSRGKPANKGWCGQPWHTATRPAVRGLPAPRGCPYAASSGGEVLARTGSSYDPGSCHPSANGISLTPLPRNAPSPPQSCRGRAPFPPRSGTRRHPMRQSCERASHRRQPAWGRIYPASRLPSGQTGDDDRHRNARLPRIDPGTVKVGQIKEGALVKDVGIERCPLPVDACAVAFDRCAKCRRENRGQRSADADRDGYAIGHDELRDDRVGSVCQQAADDEHGPPLHRQAIIGEPAPISGNRRHPR